MSKKKIALPLLDNGLGYVCADFMAGVIAAIAESKLDITIFRASDSLATRGMNRISADFLYSDCDELLILDGDLIVTGQHLKWLFEHDAELVYGAYMKRQPKAEYCFATINNDDKPPTDSPLWEVRRCGRGFTRISRSLFEKMQEENGGPAKRFHNHGRTEWEFWPCGVIEGEFSTAGQGTDEQGYPIREYISEDWMWCDRARALGVPILLDLRILAPHIGACAFPIRYTEDMLPTALNGFSQEQAMHAWAVGNP